MNTHSLITAFVVPFVISAFLTAFCACATAQAAPAPTTDAPAAQTEESEIASLPASDPAYTVKTVYANSGDDIAAVLQDYLDEAHSNATVDAPYEIDVPGESYELSKTLYIYSNTWLCLKDGAKLTKTTANSAGLMLRCGRREDSSDGYSGYSNITISGGTWDANGGASGMENAAVSTMKFGHADGITISNVTFLNNRGAHHLELGGVRNVSVTNCTFQHQYGPTGDEEGSGGQEAIQLDVIHDDDIFAGFLNDDDTLCEDVTITGNTFSDLYRGVGSHAAVLGGYYQHITIENNTFTNILEYAIIGFNFKHASISTNTLTNVGYGIDVKYYDSNYYIRNDQTTPESNSNAYIKVSGNTISIGSQMEEYNKTQPDPEKFKFPYAIRVYGLDNRNSTGNDNLKRDFQISGVTVDSNIISGYKDAKGFISKTNGILAYDAHDCSFTNNQIDLATTSNTTFTPAGIFLQAASCNNTVSENTVKNARGYGIGITEKGNLNTVSRNTVEKAGEYGIYVANSTDTNTLKDNDISDSVEDGIHLTGTSTVDIADGSIAGSGSYGISITNASSAAVTSPDIKNCGEYGVNVSYSSQATIAGGGIVGSGSNGVEVYQGSTATLKSVNISDSSHDGVMVSSSSKATITDCAVSNSGTPSELYSGIHVTGSSSAAISGCTVSSSTSYGIFITDSSNATIDACAISGSGQWGIHVSSGSTANSTVVIGKTDVCTFSNNASGNIHLNRKRVDFFNTSVSPTPFYGKLYRASSVFTWGSQDKASGYQVFRQDSTGALKSLGKTTSTTMSDSSLTIGQAYRYYVRAYATYSGSTIYGSKSAPANIGRWTSLEGAGRLNTMAEIVAEGAASADTVLVSTGFNYPDALAASALSGSLSAPIVLTDSASLSPEAQSVIASLKPNRVVIIGGTGAVSSEVEQALGQMNGVTTVVRIAGNGREETAAKVYREGSSKLGATWSSECCVIATGDKFPDSLSISPFAYANKTPIFLTQKDGTLDEATADTINKAGFKKVIIVGGPNAVSEDVKTQITTRAVFTRLSGQDRYETSSAIARWSTGQVTSGAEIGFAASSISNARLLSFANLALATGGNYPDALAGSSLIGSKLGILLLVEPESEGTSGGVCVTSLLPKNKASFVHGYFLGGDTCISPALRNSIDKSTE